MSKRTTPQTPTTLFPTAAELDVPPVQYPDADLSRIRVYGDPRDPEWIAYAARRAVRVARQRVIEASVVGVAAR